MPACCVQPLWEHALMSEGTSNVVVTFGSWLIVSCGAALIALIQIK